MKIARNYTMEKPSVYNEENGYRLKHYRGNDFWVKFPFIAIDEDGSIYNFERMPTQYIEVWIDRCEGDMICIGNVFGDVWNNKREDWRSTLKKVEIK